MKRLFALLIACSGLSFASGVTQVWISDLSFSGWQVHFRTDGSYTAARAQYSIQGSGDCAAGTGTVYTEGYQLQPGSDGSNLRYDMAGKLANTTYKVCPQVQQSGTWYGGATITITTPTAPAGGYNPPAHAIQVDTSYPAEIVSNTNVDTYTVANGCSDWDSKMNTAVSNMLTRNAIVNLPVGQANGCQGSLYIGQGAPDSLVLPASGIGANALDNYITISGGTNNAGSSITAGQWPDGTTIADGQQVTFTQPSGYSNGLPGNIVGDGRTYTLRLKDGTAHTYWVYETRTGVKVGVWNQWGGNYRISPYPRHLKNIIARTSTPDDQFLAPGSRMWDLSWVNKMAWFINSTGNHSYSGGTTLVWKPYTPGDSGVPFSSDLANIRFVGIAWTVADDPVSYTTSDPPAWNFFTALPDTTQGIILDRNAFFMPSLQQRSYTALYFVGKGNAVVNSYFDKTIAYFHAENVGGSVHQ